MASTIQLQRSVTLASSFIAYAPLTMSANDPALSNADWVRQFILSPPFAWRWNRGVVSFTTVVGVTDYPMSVPDLGWLEKGVLIFPGNGNQTQELQIENNLMREGVPSQTTRVSAQLDDDAGNVTFRIFPAPDEIYTIELTYQKSSPQFAELTDTWSPIPDYLSYVFNEGFLWRSLEYRGDPRSQGAGQNFMQMLVSANQGLTDDQKELFLGDRLNAQRQQQNVAAGRG